mgnify:CR=1 FL=1
MSELSKPPVVVCAEQALLDREFANRDFEDFEIAHLLDHRGGGMRVTVTF